MTHASVMRRCCPGAFSGLPWLVMAIAALMSWPGFAKADASEKWAFKVFRAEHKPGRVIDLLAGHASPIFLAVEADESVSRSGDPIRVEVEMEMPAAIDFVDHGGVFFEADAPQAQVEGDRRRVAIAFDVRRNMIETPPGRRARAEWRRQALFLHADAAAAGKHDLRIIVRVDGETLERRYDVTVHDAERPGVQSSRAGVELWSYVFGRVGDRGAEATAELMRFGGVTHINWAQPPLHSALASYGITAGGDTHHAVFAIDQCVDIRPSGSRKPGTFPSPYCAIQHAAEVDVLPGVETLVRHAREKDGIATIDYEPGANRGWTPDATAAFRERYGVSEQAFAAFRSYFAEEGRAGFIPSAQSPHQKLYEQWTEFHSENVGGYVREIYADFKRLMPEGRLEITTNMGLHAKPELMYAWGYDATALAPHCDKIMPQVYLGYGAAQARYLFDVVAAWRENLDARGEAARLVPLLLIRYPGAGPGQANTPMRMAQQIVASMAAGAEGVMLYYPAQMDGRHWNALARVTRRLADVEAFYLDGEPVRAVSVRGPDRTPDTFIRWPGTQIRVDEPGWHASTHKLGDRALVTLFNFEEHGEQRFVITPPEGWTATQAFDAVRVADGWEVAPQSVGYIVFQTHGAGWKE